MIHELSYYLEIYPQLTEKSERKLIAPIVSNNIFDDTTIKRLLATYPSANESAKTDLISQLMTELWKRQEIFKTFQTFDYFLALSGKRGHFVHQFEVYILGINFLLFLKGLRSDLHNDFKLQDFDQILYAWLITSTAHDFGYPVEAAHKIVGKLSELYKKFDLKYLSNSLNILDMKTIMKNDASISKMLLPTGPSEHLGSYVDIGNLITLSLMTTLDLSIGDAIALQEKFIDSAKHGYASAILISRILISEFLEENSFDDVKKTWKFHVLMSAIAAISLHNLSPGNVGESVTINKVSYDRNPLAFILMLIDNIQDWNRNIFPEEKYPDYHLDDVIITGDEFILKYVISHNTWDSTTQEIVEKYLAEKTSIVSLLTKPSPPFGAKISVHFQRNDGHKYDPIVIQI